eukprot:360381-Chlamydomonas_euryale.AAC.9
MIVQAQHLKETYIEIARARERSLTSSIARSSLEIADGFVRRHTSRVCAALMCVKYNSGQLCLC